MLGCLELSESKSWWRGGWKVAVSSALGVLGGHPQILVLMLLLGGVFALFLASRALAEGVSAKRVSWRLVLTASAVALGIGLAGAQLVPFMELVGQAGRSQAEFGSYKRVGLPFVALGQAWVPDLFGHSADGSYWLGTLDEVLMGPQGNRLWGWNYCGENLYTGVVPLLLAFLGLMLSRRSEARLFGSLAAVAILLFLGTPGILHLFYEFIPSFSHSRSDRIVYLYMCTIPILCALGWDAIQAHNRIRIHLSGVLVLSLPLIAVLWQVMEGYRAGGLGPLWERLGEGLSRRSEVVSKQGWEAVVVAVVLLILLLLMRWKPNTRTVAIVGVLLLVVLPMLRFSWKFNPVQEQPYFVTSPGVEKIASEVGEWERIARWRSSVLPPNVAQVFGLFDTNGASNAALGNYYSLISTVDNRAFGKQKYFRSFQAPLADLEPLFDYLGVGLVLTNGQVEDLQPVPTESVSSFRLYRNHQTLPRYFLVDCVEPYDDVLLARKRFHSGEFSLGQTALVSTSQTLGMDLPCRSSGGAGSLGIVSVTSYGLHEIELMVDAQNDALLISSEVDYPGWEVEVDGERRTKILVNTAFRGVFVKAGKHRVAFIYIPRSFYWGIALSGLSGILFFIVGYMEPRIREKWLPDA